MNSYKRFAFVYRTVEALYGRQITDLEILRAFKRYLHVTNQEEL